jgi:NADH dehydrogenase (ubiquinone) 1 alpha subcomplex subunit 9
VYNLVGRDYETKCVPFSLLSSQPQRRRCFPFPCLSLRNFTFDDVHVKGAGLIAKVSASVGAPRLVHVSHLNASPTSTSHFYRSKAAGETAVREVFPSATIVRPGPMFGYEDKFLNNISSELISFHHTLPKLKLYNQRGRSGGTSITVRPRLAQYMCALLMITSVLPTPTHLDAQVMDVAQALLNLVGMPAIDRTLALPGPSTLTYEYLLELVSTLTYNPPSRAPVVPKPVALALARAAQRIWWPALSPDEVERRYIDDADTPGDWAVFGVEPDEIENHAITYVRRYRSAYVFLPFSHLVLTFLAVARTISAPSSSLHDRYVYICPSLLLQY